MGLLYTGRVMRVDPGGPVVRVPLLGHDALWGPVLTTIGGLSADEQVIVGQLGTLRDQLIILGRLSAEGAIATAELRMAAIETLLAGHDVRLVSAETRLAGLVDADRRTGATLVEVLSRLGTVEYSASNLPAAVDATLAANAAAIAQLQADTLLLRQDLAAAQGDITGLQVNQSDLLLRVGALEAWKAAGGAGSGGTPPPTKPGELITLTKWELTLPIGSGTGNPDDIYAGGSPDLVTYAHPNYFRLGSDSGGYYVECAAPVNGTDIVTTSSASGASRSELREMASANGGSSGPKASWSFTDGVTHSMTVTLSVDPTSISPGRKELIIGQIHGATGTPPLYLACNFNTTKKLTLFKNGASSQGGDLLSGQVDVGTKFSYRMVKTAANRVTFAYALGDASAIPTTPQFDWPASDFTDGTGCYFKIGCYNKTQIDAAGASGVGRVRLYAVTLAAGTTTQLGKTTDGTSSSASSSDKTVVSKYTATASGVLNAGHARVWVTAGSANTKLVAYADASAAPASKLAESDVLAVTGTTEAVRDYVFSGANRANIVSGTDYWLGLAWQDPGTDSVNYSRDGTAAGRQEASSYAPASFGTPTPATGPVDVWVDVVS